MVFGIVGGIGTVVERKMFKFGYGFQLRQNPEKKV